MALFVGDLADSVTEELLTHEFSKLTGFSSVRLCRDSLTGDSLRYGYVNFANEQLAYGAMKKMNGIILHGKPIRVSWSLRQLAINTNNGLGNLFIKNLDYSIDNSKLYGIFSEYGNIMSHKIATTQDGKSKGYGYVQFECLESADLAIEKLNGKKIGKKEIYVGHFMRRSDRLQCEGNYTNLYIKYLDPDITEEILEENFSEFGKITSLIISKDSNGISRGFGFIYFEKPEYAKRAKESMNGKRLGTNLLYVGRAQKKADRELMLRVEFDGRQRKYKDTNLYVKNLSDKVNENELKELFGRCGNIESVKIMRTQNGIHRGFGFVCFSRLEEAHAAIRFIHGMMFYGKPLYVVLAQKREERKLLMENLRSTTSFWTGTYPIHQSVQQSVHPNRPVQMLRPNVVMAPGPRPIHHPMMSQVVARPVFPPPRPPMLSMFLGVFLGFWVTFRLV